MRLAPVTVQYLERGMPIIDLNAWTGNWAVFPVPGPVRAVRARLVSLGVTRICLAPLDAVWCHNPHLLNDVVYAAAREHEDIVPVPVIDPTIVTWEEEVGRAVAEHAGLVKLIPAYSEYAMDAASTLLAALMAADMPVGVQVRLEDPRRNHPLARVPDSDAAAIVAMARRYPDLTLVIGGATTAMLWEAQRELRETPRLFADISQVDGLDAVRRLVDVGLGKKLVFGSHTPLFEPLAGLARVLPELDDESAADILYRNAEAVLGNADRVGFPNCPDD